MKSKREELNKKQRDAETLIREGCPFFPAHIHKILAAISTLQDVEGYDPFYKKQWKDLLSQMDILFERLPEDFYENNEAAVPPMPFMLEVTTKNREWLEELDEVFGTNDVFIKIPSLVGQLQSTGGKVYREKLNPFWEKLQQAVPEGLYPITIERAVRSIFRDPLHAWGKIKDARREGYLTYDLFNFLETPDIAAIPTLQEKISEAGRLSKREKALLRDLVLAVGQCIMHSQFALVTLRVTEELLLKYPQTPESLRDVLRYGLVGTQADMSYLDKATRSSTAYRQRLQRSDCTEATCDGALTELTTVILPGMHELLERDLPAFFSDDTRKAIAAFTQKAKKIESNYATLTFAEKRAKLTKLHQAVGALAEDVRFMMVGKCTVNVKGKDKEILVPLGAAEQIQYYREQFMELQNYRRLKGTSVQEVSDQLNGLSEKQLRHMLQAMVLSPNNFLDESDPFAIVNTGTPEQINNIRQTIESFTRKQAIEYLKKIFLRADQEHRNFVQEQNKKHPGTYKETYSFPVDVVESFYVKEMQELLCGKPSDIHKNADKGLQELIEKLKVLKNARPGVINDNLLNQAKKLAQKIKEEHFASGHTVIKYKIAEINNSAFKSEEIRKYIEDLRGDNNSQTSPIKGGFIDISWIDFRGVDISGIDFKGVTIRSFESIEQIAVARNLDKAKGLPFSLKDIKAVQNKVKKAAVAVSNHPEATILPILQTIGKVSTTPYNMSRSEAVLIDVIKDKPQVLNKMARFQVKDVAETLMESLNEEIEKNRTILHPKGRYAGIGVEMWQQADGRMMIRPMSNASAGEHTPGFNAIQGIVELKEITDSHGRWVSVAGMSLKDVAPMFKGLVGTTVALRYETSNGMRHEKPFYRQLINADNKAPETFTNLDKAMLDRFTEESCNVLKKDERSGSRKARPQSVFEHPRGKWGSSHHSGSGLRKAQSMNIDPIEKTWGR